VLVQIDTEHWWPGFPRRGRTCGTGGTQTKPGLTRPTGKTWNGPAGRPTSAVKIAWRNWGRQIRVLPPPNLASPRYVAACREEIRRLVPVVMDWHAQLPLHKKHLLVGIKLGHETSIGVNAYHYPSGNDLLDKAGLGRPRASLGRFDVLARGMAQIGYAALKSSGIRSDGVPTESECETWRNTIWRCSAARRLKPACRASACLLTAPAGIKGELIYDVPVNPYACPGWSFYNHAADPRKDSGVQRNLAKSDAPYWAATEWLLLGTRKTDAWRDALTHTLSDPRCRYVCIFNWESIRTDETVQQAITQLVEAGMPCSEPRADSNAAPVVVTFCNR
jgi:hypothetical protein